MRRYETKVLSLLLDKYESSLVYRGENKKRQRITCAVNDKLFPEYFDLSSMAYDQIHEELLEMEEKGLIILHWNGKKDGHVLKEVELNLDAAKTVYEILKRPPRSGLERQALEVIQAFDGIHDNVTENVREWLSKRITAGESVKKYVDIADPEQLSLLLTALHAMASNQAEMYVREFSILHFHDSKMFEKMEGKLLSLMRAFYHGVEGCLEELEDEQILNLFGIYKNPAYVMVKGAGALRFGGLFSKAAEGAGRINLNQMAGGIGIHSQDLEQVIFEQGSAVKQVMTVENLTVFHRIGIPDTLFIYLGGYHNTARRRFLMKVHEAFPEAAYLHFGDIDCGGFKILEDLRTKTGIAFGPYLMDCHTLLKYGKYGRPLSQNDRKELKRMLEETRYERYQKVLRQMLETGTKLEQECIQL